MNREILGKIAVAIGQRVAGPDNKINKTLAASVGGSALMGAASVLLAMPEPNAQIAGGVLMAIGIFGAWWQERKKTDVSVNS